MFVKWSFVEKMNVSLFALTFFCFTAEVLDGD